MSIHQAIIMQYHIIYPAGLAHHPDKDLLVHIRNKHIGAVHTPVDDMVIPRQIDTRMTSHSSSSPLVFGTIGIIKFRLLYSILYETFCMKRIKNHKNGCHPICISKKFFQMFRFRLQRKFSAYNSAYNCN